MSQSINSCEKSMVCGAADLDTKRYYVMKQHTDGTVIIAAAATDAIIGVLQNKPKIGEPALIRFGGTTKVISGGAINPGAWVTSDGNGAVIATTTDKNVVLGKYLGSAAAASGDIIEVQLGIFTLSA
jgi:hypothetical protein